MSQVAEEIASKFFVFFWNLAFEDHFAKFNVDGLDK